MKHKSQYQNKHTFALYIPNFSEIVQTNAQNIIISDSQILHRMIHVLRFTAETECILFDRYIHADAVVESITKKEISFRLDSIVKNKRFEPNIAFYLPILKRQALENALYSLVECGISDIQLVETEKSHRKKINDKEFKRLQNIVIAAAEQSKYFSFPEIQRPISLNDTLENIVQRNGSFIYSDMSGNPVGDVIKSISPPVKNISLMIGPEADLTMDEKKLLKKYNAKLCRLTPTILRAQQAAGLCAGIFRSFFYISTS